MQSAFQRYSHGQANAELAYATGRGVSLNYVEAYMWPGLATAEVSINLGGTARLNRLRNKYLAVPKTTAGAKARDSLKQVTRPIVA